MHPAKAAKKAPAPKAAKKAPAPKAAKKAPAPKAGKKAPAPEVVVKTTEQAPNVVKTKAEIEKEFGVMYYHNNFNNLSVPAFKMPSYTYAFRWECIQKYEANKYKNLQEASRAMGISGAYGDGSVLSKWLQERDAIKKLAEDPATANRVRMRGPGAALADPDGAKRDNSKPRKIKKRTGWVLSTNPYY